jgi:AcrR family transcriptional regulator
MDAAQRPHTGRQRNEAARQAILDAALELLGESAGAGVTVDAIAARAGVGKQTIYRWWPSKYAVLLDAILQRARLDVPAPDTGNVATDLREFLRGTFRGARNAGTAAFLRAMMGQAQQDPGTAEVMREFTASRRQALRELLERGQARGELSGATDLDLIVDQVYGLLWYRLMVGHAPLGRDLADKLTDAVLAQAAG